MTNNSPFEESEVESFDDFEQTYARILKNRRIYHTFFRGQSESIWNLIPSLFRDLPEEIPVNTLKDRMRSEFSHVSRFVQVADQIGFNMPGELLEFLNPEYFDIQSLENFIYWCYKPSPTWEELLTIAQHYGVKTRYLDFSYSPYAALYFAAEEVVKKLLKEKDSIEGSNDKFSLWMLDSFNLRNMPGKDNTNVRYLRVPTTRNSYLNAQKGLFLTPPLPKLSNDSDIISISKLDVYNIIIENNEERVSEGEEGLQRRWPTIYKFNFPFDVAPQVLQDLNNKLDINLATLKPNLENIVISEDFKLKVNNLAYEYRQKKGEPY